MRIHLQSMHTTTLWVEICKVVVKAGHMKEEQVAEEDEKQAGVPKTVISWVTKSYVQRTN